MNNVCTETETWFKTRYALPDKPRYRRERIPFLRVTGAVLRLIGSKPQTREREQFFVSRIVANVLSLLPYYASLKIFSTKVVVLPKQMLGASGTDFASWRAQSRKPPESKIWEGKANAVYKLREKIIAYAEPWRRLEKLQRTTRTRFAWRSQVHQRVRWD